MTQRGDEAAGRDGWVDGWWWGVEQKAPVIERMFQLWPGDRVNRLTSVLVGDGEGALDHAEQGRVGGQTLLQINRIFFWCQRAADG